MTALVLPGFAWASASAVTSSLWLAVLCCTFIVAARLRSIDSLLAAGAMLGAVAPRLLSFEVAAETAAPFAVWAGITRRPIWVVLAIEVGLARSRIGILAVAAALWVAWRGAWRAKLLVAAIAAAIALGSLYGLGAGKMGSAAVRLFLWLAMVEQVTVFGHGLGWFYVTYPVAAVAHSDLIQLVLELGIGAAFFLAIPLAVLWRAPAGPEKSLLTAACVEGAVSFPMHTPIMGLTAAVVAGYLAGESR